MPASSVQVRQTFRKSERLSGRKTIEEVALKGEHIHIPPLRLHWIATLLPGNVPYQIAFSVSKKRFKNASDRNKIKRRMREGYRKNKSFLNTFNQNNRKQYAFLLVFTGNKSLTFAQTEEIIKTILKRFAETIQKNNG